MRGIVTSLFQCLLLFLSLAYRNCQLHSGYRCETLRTSICKDVLYNETILPNILGHNDQDEAKKSIQEFNPLIKIECSPQLRPLLCFFYFPVCTILMEPIPPCRLLCQKAKEGCENLLNNFGYEWPAVLDCNKFPKSGLCVGENLTTSRDDSEGFPKGGNRKPIWLTPPTFTRTRILHVPTAGVTDGFADDPVFLLLSSWNKILLYDMSTSDLITLQSGLDQGAAVDFLYSKQTIYWASHGDSRIYQGSLTLDVLRDVKVLVDVGPATIESIAVDWVSEHIFWLESYPTAIKVASLDGRYPTKILSQELSNPKSLILDPLEGFLFWIDWAGTLYSPYAYIEKYDLTHNTHSVIFNITQFILPGMGRPVGLTSDLDNQRLYWVDAKSETIQGISYTGTDFGVIVRGSSLVKNYLTEPCSVAIFRDTIFWTDRTTKTIMKTSKNIKFREAVMETLTASPPMDMKVFHSYAQPPGIPSYTIELDLTSGSPRLGGRVYVILLIFIVQETLINKLSTWIS